MRQGDLSKLARVRVDIANPLDDLWTLDIKKSTATPPEEVRKKLSVVIEKLQKEVNLYKFIEQINKIASRKGVSVKESRGKS